MYLVGTTQTDMACADPSSMDNTRVLRHQRYSGPRSAMMSDMEYNDISHGLLRVPTIHVSAPGGCLEFDYWLSGSYMAKLQLIIVRTTKNSYHSSSFISILASFAIFCLLGKNDPDLVGDLWCDLTVVLVAARGLRVGGRHNQL